MVSLKFARGSDKPSMGARANYDHPFMQGVILGAAINEVGCAGGAALRFNMYTGTGVERTGVAGGGALEPIWGSNVGGPCIVCNSGFNTINLGDAAVFPASAVTVAVIRRKTDTTARNAYLFTLGDPAADEVIRVAAPYGDTTLYWEFGDNISKYMTIAGLTYHTRLESWVFTAGARGLEVWRDGVLIGSDPTVYTRTPCAAGTESVYLNNSSSLVSGDHQEINTIHTVGVQWSPELCRWWSAEPYAHMYEPSIARRYYFIAASGGAQPFLTINGTEVRCKIETFSVLKSSGRPARCAFDLVTTTGPNPWAIGDDVVATENGTSRIFGGLIDDIDEGGLGRYGVVPTSTTISAGSYMAYADFRTNVTETFAAQSLITTIEALRSEYLDDYGVTLSPTQVTGPTVEALEYAHKSLRFVFNDIAQKAGGYSWKIDDYKVLSFFLPSSSAAGFSITTANRKAIGDIRVKRSASGFANRVILLLEASGAAEITDTFTGDGVTTAFTLTAYITAWRGYVTCNAINETLDYAGFGATWVYDPSNKTITRTSAPGNGQAISIIYTGQFPLEVIAEDAASIAAVGLREMTVTRPYDGTVTSGLADELLAVALVAGTEVRYQTAETDIEPGDTQTIEVAERGVSSATYTATEVEIRNTRGNLMRRFVTAAVGDVARPDLLPVATYDLWAGTDLESA